MADARERTNTAKVWTHCSPGLLYDGVDCATTPRRPCECDHGGSHDHLVDAPKPPIVDGESDD